MQVMQRIQPDIVFIELHKDELDAILPLDEQELLKISKCSNFQIFQRNVQQVVLIITARKLSAFVAGTFIFKIFRM